MGRVWVDVLPKLHERPVRSTCEARLTARESGHTLAQHISHPAPDSGAGLSCCSEEP
jgi:hypothetical protein